MYANNSEKDYADTCYMHGQIQDPVFKGGYSFNTGIVQKLSAQDFVVFVFLLLLTFIFGAYHSWRNKQQETVAEFLLAYRQLSGIPVGISVAASCISGLTVFANFSEIYMFNTMNIYFGPAVFLAVLTAAHVFHPVFYRLQVSTATEYLELRFNKTVRTIAAILYVCTLLAYLSMNWYAPMIALKEVTGLSLWGSIVVMAFVCITITSVGGMQSVVKADLFQLMLIFLSMVVVLGRAIHVVGSWETMQEANRRANRLVYDEMRGDLGIRHSVFPVVLGGYIAFNSYISTTQLIVQKTVCCNTIRDVKIAVMFGFLIYCTFGFIIDVLSMYISAFYENCDPLTVNLVGSSEEILPLFVMDTLSNTYGLAGLFSAGLLVACLSTTNSGFSAVTSTIIEDIILNYKQFYISPLQANNVARIIIVIYGLVVLTGTYVVSKIGSLVQATFALFGLLGTALFGVYALGLFFPWTNTEGALSGLFGSLAIMLTVALTTSPDAYYDKKALRCIRNCNPYIIGNYTIKEDKIPEKFHLSHMWYAPIILFSCIGIGLLVSLATGPLDPSFLDRNLYVLVLDDVFPFYHLPESFRERFRHDVRKPEIEIDLGRFSDVLTNEQVQIKVKVDESPQGTSLDMASTASEN